MNKKNIGLGVIKIKSSFAVIEINYDLFFKLS